jgi:hypothetical protein
MEPFASAFVAHDAINEVQFVGRRDGASGTFASISGVAPTSASAADRSGPEQLRRSLRAPTAELTRAP